MNKEERKKAKRKEYRDKPENKERQKEYYKSNIKKILKKQKEYDKKRDRKKVYEYIKKRYQTDKEFKRKFLVRKKARGKISIPKKQICGICKKNLAVERHHEDYSKPLEVKFLCKKCHINIHKIK